MSRSASRERRHISGPVTSLPLTEKKEQAVVSKLMFLYDGAARGYLLRHETYQLLWDALYELGMGSSQLLRINDLIEQLERSFADGNFPYEAVGFILKPLIELGLKQQDF